MRYTYRFPSLRKRKNLVYIFINIAVLIFLLFLLFRFGNLELGSFLANFFGSFLKVCIAYVMALFLALILAFVTIKTKTTERIFLPILDVLQSFPSFALLPILLAYLGRNVVSLLLILIMAMVWPILFSIIGNFKGIKGDIAEAATIFGAVGAKRLLSFTIPALMPGIVTGSIVAWGEAWETVVGAEIILSLSGLGGYFLQIGGAAELKQILIAVTGLLILLYILNRLFWLQILDRVSKYQTD